mgnify:CR=1 FL=1
MSTTKVAINGFGRIGRTFFRMAVDHPDIEVFAINDLGDIENLAYLLRYDTVYGQSGLEVSTEPDALVVNGARIAFSQIKDPKTLPWQSLGVDIVLEATGVFTSYATAKAHLEAGAKRVVISAPVKDDPTAAAVDGATVLMGVNEDELKTCTITSNASCTTNASSPLVSILKAGVGIEKALLNTVHAYTATQSIVDGPAKDLRKGRAAAQNIIPTSTGAAVATTKVHTELTDKFDGIAMRVPVPVGSIVDITFVASRETSVAEVNQLLKDAAESKAWNKLFAVTDEPIVSSDIIGARFAAIADLSFTRVVGGNLVKVLAWYDNETSYTHTLLEHTAAVARFLGRKDT